MAPGIVAGIHRAIVRVTTEDGIVGLGESPSPDDALVLAGPLGQGLVGMETGRAPRRARLGPAPRPTHRVDGKVVIDRR